MSDTNLLACDGCGQFAAAGHIAARLKRLEWATRYRPVHIQTLLLGGMVPAQQSSFLYAESEQFSGEAGQILEAVEISTEGKARETVLSEFQKRGMLLIHVLECPLEGRLSTSEIAALLERQWRATQARVRRSLKPKRVLVFCKEMETLAPRISEAELECPVMMDGNGKPFVLEGTDPERFREIRRALSREFWLQK